MFEDPVEPSETSRVIERENWTKKVNYLWNDLEMIIGVGVKISGRFANHVRKINKWNKATYS